MVRVWVGVVRVWLGVSVVGWLGGLGLVGVGWVSW